MPAMGTQLASDTGAVTQRLIDYHVERSRGLVGLQITEVACIDSPLGKTIVNQLRIDHDRYVPGLNQLVEAVHLHGGKMAVQLHHAGRQTNLTATEGLQPVSASEVAYYDEYGIPPGAWVSRPRALTVEEIQRLVEKFAEGAERAKRAQMDAVELHGAHGYLIGQFLSPYTNKRTDLYGGSLEKRLRFAVDVVERTREKVGANFPIIFRISADEMIPEGLKLDEAKIICKRLEEVGVDAFNVSAAIYESEHWCEQPMATPRGCLTHLSAGIRAAVTRPVIAVGRINNPLLAEEILENGKADLVAMGRALLADPELPKKSYEERTGDIRMCTACNIGCISRVGWQGLSISCQVNPAVGREREYELTRVGKPRNIIVIGGGPGGMETARVAALRGHSVRLYDSNTELGGQILLASKPPHKEELQNILSYYTTQLRNLKVRVELNETVDERTIINEVPDAMILATGAVPLIPDISGVNSSNVVTAWDVLKGIETPNEKTVVVGGGEVGCETAEFIASSGAKVTVTEMLDYVGGDVELLTRRLLLERLRKLGVQFMTDAKVVEIVKDGIYLTGQRRGREYIEASTVVLATGSKPKNDFAKPLSLMGAEFHVIGDCVEPRGILEAIREGSQVGRLV
jgi:2,4-dienoyl-CoA reductase-like NADH-dependent reductase (Old Yellow Enzyme family)/thioredoxin reductase